MMGVHERLKEERERVGLTQPQIADVLGVGKTTVINWEKGASAPSAQQLAEMVAKGIDVTYVVTGRRISSQVDLDPLRRAVLDSFDRCSPEKQIEAVQYMALLAAGVAPGPSGETAKTVTKAKVNKSILGVAVGSVVGRKK